MHPRTARQTNMRPRGPANKIVKWKQWEGQVIDGRFPLHEYLGGSASSAVFLTEYGNANPQKAAIKLIRTNSGRGQNWMQRQAQAARLSHPGLLSIFRLGECDSNGTGLVYAVTEYADEDIAQVIPVRVLTASEVRELLLAVAETLGYLHAEGFVHARLTPSNILACGDRIKLSRDGLLRIGETNEDRWPPDVHRPPEWRTGLTPAGDVWSLGVTLLEAMTQHPPRWGGGTNPAVPETLASPYLDIIRNCLQSDPVLRCSVADVARSVRPTPPFRPVRASVVMAAPKSVPKTMPAGPKHRLVAAAITLALIATGAILTRSMLSSSTPSAEPGRAAVAERPVAQDQPPAVPAALTTEGVVRSGSGAVSDAPTTGDVLVRVVPVIPQEILKNVRGRRVSVRVQTDAMGNVADAELATQPGSKYFDKASLEAARRWKFKPASEGGSTRVLRFEFRKDGCDAVVLPGQAR